MYQQLKNETSSYEGIALIRFVSLDAAYRWALVHGSGNFTAFYKTDFGHTRLVEFYKDAHGYTAETRR